MVLAQVTVHGAFAGESEADAGGDEAMGFLGRIFADDGEGDLAGLMSFRLFTARNEFAVGRKNRTDADDVASRDTCVS